MTKPQSPAIMERKERRRTASEGQQGQRNAAIIKVGKMSLWEGFSDSEPKSVSSSRRGSVFPGANYQKKAESLSNWQRISCTLHENGHFKLLTEADAQTITFIQLSQLSRCAVQLMDPSVLGEEFCIGLYPQYSVQSSSSMPPRPIFMCLENRVLFEVWFVLLRAFTVPELYGPQQSLDFQDTDSNASQKASQDGAASGMFRVERVLSVRITEAKLRMNNATSPTSKRQVRGDGEEFVGNLYSEIHLDGEVRARTAVKSNTSKPFWREEFTFIDLPPVLSSAALLVKAKNSSEKEWTMVSRGAYPLNYGDNGSQTMPGTVEVSMQDSSCGAVELQLDELEHGQGVEKWWPIYDASNNQIGEVLMMVRLDETIVLMTQDFAPLSNLLHTFANGLTIRLAKELNTEVKQFSEIFLDIFQVSNHVSEWIMTLIEDEIDSNEKETASNRLRYSGRIFNNETTADSVPEREMRELVLRDMGKSAATEANLLFRGNTLLTRAFDAHMRRLGKEYLLETIGDKLREIDENNIDCEVDPNKVTNPDESKRNWRKLLEFTTSMWKAIHGSASRCPAELRLLFRHVRSCAEDRYGDFQRTVSYSSVSGFLFLRFFCPAILNPKLFGLLKSE